jgi:hypothetical protein
MADDIHTPTEENFVPEQVRRQAARAEELTRQLNEEEQQPTTGSDQPEPEILPPEEPPPQQDSWEQRYRTLQGKYDSEMGHMRGQIGSLERLLATMQTPQAQPPAPPPGAPPTYDEADVELYGEDLLNAATRAAEAKFGNEINNLKQQVQHLSGRQEEDRVFRELDQDPELAGRWRDINISQNYLNWLQAVDEFSGVSRNVMLQHAYQSGDAVRTGRFFKRYMAEHTAPPPTATVPQTAAPARYNNGGNGHAAAGGPRLEDMAAPGRAAGSGSGNGAPSQRFWSRPEITAFYRARTMGKYKGREAEAEQLEADLLRANAEGRIV